MRDRFEMGLVKRVAMDEVVVDVDEARRCGRILDYL